MSVFKFKQFEVDQQGCAMKINTDGVLLAAKANHSYPHNILDIGTGTGVIALMLAQRYPDAYVEAIEIDEQASETARYNFQQSAFKDRLVGSHIAIQDYVATKKFDLIVSNPPFFLNDLKSEELRKGIARHADLDFFEALVVKSAGLLTEKGLLWLILPPKQADLVVGISASQGLTLLERIHIHSDESKPVFRQIIVLGKESRDRIERDFYIYESFQQYTSAYRQLLKDFFLAF
jgi:tRNA1Val (adenine37-N6)-methyltransferase